MVSRIKNCSSHSNRRGVTMAELIISSVILLVVMTFVTSICFRVNLVWKDIGHHRVALGELANQLEVLTAMKPDEAIAALETLEPSGLCKRTLQSPELNGEAIRDDLGTRIVLRMAWHKDREVKPVELAGWIVSASPAKKKTSPVDESNKPAERDELTEDAPPQPRLEAKQ